MKPLFFILLLISTTAIGQDIDRYKGFTDRTKAVNFMDFNEKDGKWIEFMGATEGIVRDTNLATYYRLVVYDHAKIKCPVHYYYKKSGKPYKTLQYVGNQINGNVNTYYETGSLKSSVFYLNSEKCGTEKLFNERGSLISTHEYKGDYNMIDSGFTDKSQAKNFMLDHKKEGKWQETIYWHGCFGSDSAFNYYELAVYKHNIPTGIIRQYDKYWNLINISLFKPLKFTLAGMIRDKDSHKGVAGVMVKLYNSSGNRDSVVTNIAGMYAFGYDRLNTGVSYIIAVDPDKQGYRQPDHKSNFNTVAVNKDSAFVYSFDIERK